MFSLVRTKITKKPYSILLTLFALLILTLLNLPRSSLTADNFSNFFYDKISKIRSQIPSYNTPLPVTPNFIPACLPFLSLTTSEEVSNTIKASKKTNTPLEIFPSRFYPDLLPEILSQLVLLFNSSFSSGLVPDAFKNAIVKPLLKKPNLDPNDPNNYRPISLLPFLSKILERLVHARLLEHMNFIQLDEQFQSGFKNLHSTESALLYVTDKLRMSADKNQISILITLDLSAAFDTIDHSTLLDTLHSHLGISDLALDWFRSYLSNRFQTVLFNNNYSDPKPMPHGVPQGSVDGPLLFRIYLVPLLILLKQLGLSYHIYADDTQVYLCCSPDHYEKLIERIKTCYTAISNLLSKLFLKLNHKKTEIILIGNTALVEKCKLKISNIKLSDSLISFSSFIKNLGVIFDEDLSYEKHIKTVSNFAMFRLRNLRHVRSHFDKHSFQIIIHASITSRLDYCNSLLSGLPASSLRHLQLVQNYAARLILNRSKYCHITPLLHELHWLPITSRIKFKVLLFVYKSLHDLAPTYLSNLLQYYQPSRPLRSSDSKDLIIPRTNKVTMGDRAFSVIGPKLWNDLPSDLKNTSTINSFKKLLKTHLFAEYYDILRF